MEKALLLCSLVMASIVFGCEEAAKALNIPVPEIVGATARESLGLDYQVHVDCTIKNNGASGDITVTAELNKGGFWEKEQTVFIPEDGTKKVTLTFSEPTFLGGGLTSGQYTCGAKP